MLVSPQSNMKLDIMSFSEPILPSWSSCTPSLEPHTKEPSTAPCVAKDRQPLMLNAMLFVPKLELITRSNTCPQIMIKYCGDGDFDAFNGEWIDSKGETALISPLGVIRYPCNPSLRFDARYLGPNLISVSFDKEKKKCIAKLNHDCSLIMWDNDVQWARKGSKYDKKDSKCLVQ
eukprot:51671_1